ncbi:phosphotransferase family protein [Nakamurella sp.]|uniref:phosphotransferase family protein n=1 Tax=Nakamurella sp. TaxID=1869182 RepID=UPI0037850D4E
MPAVLPRIRDLLAGLDDLEPMPDAPGKSGARLRRGRRDGHSYVVKFIDAGRDWTQHASGVLGGPIVPLWQRGILDRLPDCINQPIIAVADEGHGSHRRTAILMHDVARWLIPPVDESIPLSVHQLQLAHLATMHATLWEPGAEFDVVPEMHRYLELSPWTAWTEAAIGSDHVVPPLLDRGWQLLPQVAPRAAAIVGPLALDPGPLVQALGGTPQSFVHGNWKLDNLGLDDRGRTVLIDWELPGIGAPCGDLAWYLAINCRRLPQSKEAAIADYRAALEAAGVDTGGWWDRQLGLALLGALVQFGWEKAFGGYDDELAWWADRATEGARYLG